MASPQKIEQFLKDNEVNCLSIVGENAESHFSWRGCDICKNGLGNSVYDCNGYSPKHKQIFDGFQVCHECICYLYNGE